MIHQRSLVPWRLEKGRRFSSIPGAGMLSIGGIKIWQSLVYRAEAEAVASSEVELQRTVREDDSIFGDLGWKGTTLYQAKSNAI